MFLALFLFSFSSPASAQRAEFALRGKVLDNVTRLDVPGARVEVLRASDSILVTEGMASVEVREGERTWHTADYDIKISRRDGDYVLRVTLPGYEAAFVGLSLHGLRRRETERTLPPILLRRKDINEIGEVEVRATKVKFYHRGDTLVYDASAFRTAEGSMLDALVRQLPGVELRDNGQIYVNGRFIENLLLNGKDFFRGNHRVMLDNLPTYMVSDVQVYEKWGDDSEFLGRDAVGDSQYVMDVKLKKQYAIGGTGNVETGDGTEDRYLARLFAMRFTDHSRIALFANANNLNDGRRPGENSQWSPADLGEGRVKQQLGGLDYSVDARSKTFKVNGNVQVTHSVTEVDKLTNRTNFLRSGDTHDRVREAGRSKRLALFTYHRFYTTFRHANLEVTPRLDYSKTERRSDYASLTWSGTDSTCAVQSSTTPPRGRSRAFGPTLNEQLLTSLLNRNLRSSLSDGHSFSASLSLKSLVKFNHSSDNLTLSAEASCFDASQRQYDHNLVEYFSAGEAAAADFRNRFLDQIPQRGYHYSAKAGYSYRINRAMTLNLNYKYGQRHTRQSSALFFLDRVDGWGEGTQERLGHLPVASLRKEAADETNSYDSRQHDREHVLEPQLFWSAKSSHSSWNGQVMAPLTLLSRKLHYVRGDIDTTFTSSIALFNVGNTFVKWQTNDHKYGAQMQYSLKMEATEMHWSVPYRDTTDPLNVMEGGARLKNSLAHTLIGSFQRVFAKQGSMAAVEAVFQPRQHVTALGYIYDKATGRRTFIPCNVDGNWRGSLFSGGTFPVNKSKTVIAKLFGGVSAVRSVDLVGLEGEPRSARTVMRTINAEFHGQADWQSGKSKIGVKADYVRGHTTASRADFSDIHSTDLNYGLTGLLALPWRLELSTDLTVFTRRGYANQQMNADDVVWNVRLSRPFLHGRLVCLVDGFDLLSDLTNISRALRAQSLTETRTNVVPHYIMCHVIYRFKSVPKKRP